MVSSCSKCTIAGRVPPDSTAEQAVLLQLGAGLLWEAKVGLRANQLLLYLLEANLSRARVNCSVLCAVTGTKLQAHDIPDCNFKCSLQIPA